MVHICCDLTNVKSTVPLATARDKLKYLRGSPQHLTASHQRLTAPTLNLRMERMTELDLVQDEIDEAKRSLEEAHLEVQAAQS